MATHPPIAAPAERSRDSYLMGGLDQADAIIWSILLLVILVAPAKLVHWVALAVTGNAEASLCFYIASWLALATYFGVTKSLIFVFVPDDCAALASHSFKKARSDDIFANQVVLLSGINLIGPAFRIRIFYDLSKHAFSVSDDSAPTRDATVAWTDTLLYMLPVERLPVMDQMIEKGALEPYIEAQFQELHNHYIRNLTAVEAKDNGIQVAQMIEQRARREPDLLGGILITNVKAKQVDLSRKLRDTLDEKAASVAAVDSALDVSTRLGIPGMDAVKALKLLADDAVYSLTDYGLRADANIAEAVKAIGPALLQLAPLLQRMASASKGTPKGPPAGGKKPRQRRGKKGNQP